MAEELGGGLAALAVSALAVANAVGRPLFGMICDRIGPKFTLLTVQALQLTALLVAFPLAMHVIAVYAGAVLIGAAFGAYLAVMPTLTSYFFGTKNVGPNYGLLFFGGYGVGGLTLPVVLTAVIGPVPAYETYLMGFYAMATFVILGMVLTLFLKPPKPLLRLA